MAQLKEIQVNKIYDFLVEHGISYEALHTDLLDHICCMVEEKMDNGKDFGESFTLSIQEFGLSNLTEIQEATIHLLTIKVKKMKKGIGILGITSAFSVICGVFFKTNHWPGANLLLIIGLCLACLVVFPFMAYFDTHNGKNAIQKAGVISGYLASILLSLATLIKIMKWPAFIYLYYPGLFLLVFVFLPIYTWKNYKTAENKIMAFSKSLLIFAGITVFCGLFPGGKSSYYNSNNQPTEQHYDKK